MPLNAVPGVFAALTSGEQTVVDATNYARYVPYVNVVQAVDAPALVRGYVRLYPLFSARTRSSASPASTSTTG